MKLATTTKRFGWTHVRGGRVVRVIKPHSVPTSTLDVQSIEEVTSRDAHPRAQAFHKPYVLSAIGDLAIEILYVKTDKLLGYAYLSGDAVNLMRYDAAKITDYEIVTAYHLDLSKIVTLATPEAFAAVIIQIAESRAHVAFGKVSLQLADEDVTADMGVFMNVLFKCWRMVPVQLSDDEAAVYLKRRITHLLLDLEHVPVHSNGKRAKAKPYGTLHYQPKRDLHEFGLQPFVQQLVSTSVRLTALDPFSQTAF